MPVNEWSTLKKLIWMRVIFGGSEHTATVRGVSPLALVNALADPINSLVQYGKCVQNGTPTPAASEAIYCNNGKITNTRNVFNAPVTLGGTITNSGGNGSSNSARMRMGYRYFPAGTYTISTTGICNNIIVWSYSSSSGADPVRVSDPSAFEALPYTFTLSEGRYIRAMCRQSSNPTLTEENVGDWQIERGDTATEYIDPGLIINGSPEVLKITGRQLFDVDTMIDGNGYILENGNARSNITWRYTVFIPVTPGQYTLSGASKGGNNTYVGVYDENQDFVESFLIVANQPLTFTVPANGRYVRLSLRAGQNEYKTSMFELGSVVHSFEVYHKEVALVETLFAVGSYKDDQEIVSGAVTRRVDALVLDGTESWSTISSGRGFYVAAPGLSGLTGRASWDGLCTHLEFTAWPNQSNAFAYDHFSYNYVSSTGKANGNLTVRPRDMTLAKWTEFLAENWVQGTPVVFIYPIAEATTESVEPQPLNTTRGYNVIDVTSSVNPVELQVEYTIA